MPNHTHTLEEKGSNLDTIKIPSSARIRQQIHAIQHSNRQDHQDEVSKLVGRTARRTVQQVSAWIVGELMGRCHREHIRDQTEASIPKLERMIWARIRNAATTR